MPIPAILAALAVAQGAKGIYDKAQASATRNRAENNFRRFQIPGAVNNMLSVAHGLSSQTEVPGADIYRNRAKAALSQGIEQGGRVAESAPDLLGTIRDMFSSYNQFEQGMAAKGADLNYQAQMNELNVLKQVGDYQTQAWKFNYLMPYMQKMNLAGQQDAAGNANINSAFSSGMSIAGANWDLNNQQKMFEDWKKAYLEGLGTTTSVAGGTQSGN